MIPNLRRPAWQMPAGVSRSLLDYVDSPHIAIDYDNYFAHHRLFDFDQQILLRHVTGQGTIVDLGCGTGRALVPLLGKGRRGIAVDLSPHMLQIVQQKAEAAGLDILPVRSNMVELDWLARCSVEYVICMFSSIGMVQGAVNREQVLSHVQRVLKPGGKFVLHVHNYWFNLRDPGGPKWVIKNLFQSALSRDVERGDRYFPYRGIPNMFLHVFTRRELSNALSSAALRIIEWIPLDPARHCSLRRPWFAQGLRANGWIVVAERE